MPTGKYTAADVVQPDAQQTSDAGVQGGPPTVSGLKSLAIGALKGLDTGISGADEFARKHLPAFMTNTGMGFGKPADLGAQKQAQKPANAIESLGKGAEQAGEFLLPGAGEEKIGAAAGKFAPLAKIGYNALTTGTLNKLQGGDFSTGALIGGIGGAASEGLAAAAPKVAESGLSITKADRGFGKSPGKAIIEETRGIRPETIETSAQGRLNQLNPQLEQAANRASVQPNRIRGLLQAPERDVPLNRGINRGSTKGDLFPAGINPEEPMEPRSGNPLAPISEYPGINPHYLSGTEHPEMAGRFGPPSGALRTREDIGRLPTDEFGRVIHQEPSFSEIPSLIPNRVASLAPARGVISGAQGKATQQGARTTLNQLGPMATHLAEDIGGAPIGENVTPRKLLDLRRGFNDEFGHWNPETLPGVSGTGRQAYHALTDEFHRAVPGIEDIDQRISNLIPVVKRAESATRNPPLIQRTAGRIGAHTGALATAGIGAAEGRREGGLPGMIVGGTAGLLAPELLATPEGRMIAARTMALPTARNLLGAPAKGLALQLNRKDEQ